MADQTELIYEFDLDEELVLPLQQLLEGGGPMADAVFDTMIAGQDHVIEQIALRTPVNLGWLRSGTSRGEPVLRGTVFEGEVMNPLSYGLPVEYGRKPGKMPPVDAIQFWVMRKGLAGTYSIKTQRRLGSYKTQDEQDRQMAWAVAKRIAKYGTKGAFMFRDGLIAAKPAVDALWEALLEQIVEEWAG